MPLAELRSIDFVHKWARLTPGQQAEISMAALAQEFAFAVAEDDGSETTDEDRLTASHMADEANNALPAIIQAAFPEVALCPCTDLRPTHHVDYTYDAAD